MAAASSGSSIHHHHHPQYTNGIHSSSYSQASSSSSSPSYAQQGPATLQYAHANANSHPSSSVPAHSSPGKAPAHTHSYSTNASSSTSHSHAPTPSTSTLPSISSSSSSTSSPALSSSLSTPTTSTTAGSTPGFVRDGDTLYDHGPPPPAPLPAVGGRSYTVLKEVGDGSFGTVWLADWHSPLALPRNTGPPGPSSRPEYKGKRLVALKRMKKAFEGGWEECMKLKELKSLRSIPLHPNIIPLYDAFILPSSKELYFVFECMEGNLYQLTKSRKGRPLAAGLVASLLRQILLGLDHIHASGYFHRDMKPENLLITTTGLADYPCYVSPAARQNVANANGVAGRGPEKDVVAIVKIADFGLARETKSRPPYTEYVSTRWYRAPEVLLRSRDYSAPVDMWAVGTILSEMVNLKPLFPGQSEVDQVYRICEILGDPSTEYGSIEYAGRTQVRGGGPWERGIKMAKQVGFSFPRITPTHFPALFDQHAVPPELVDIMADLMRYDPKNRLTTAQCLQHPYFTAVAPALRPTLVPSLPNHVVKAQQLQQQQQQQQQQTQQAFSGVHAKQQLGHVLPPASPSVASPSPREVPPSHSHSSQHTKAPFDPSPASSMHHYHPSSSSQQQQIHAQLGLPPPQSSASSAYSASDYYASAQARGGMVHSQPHQHAVPQPNGAAEDAAAGQHRHSVAHSLVSNDGSLPPGMHVHLGSSVASDASSPGMGYPESVSNDDVAMEDQQEHIPMHSHAHAHEGLYVPDMQRRHRQGSSNANVSPVPSSVYSFGQGETLSHPSHHQQHQGLPQLPTVTSPSPAPSISPPGSLPPPIIPPHHHLAQLRQGRNGYASSVHSGSFYNSSIYSSGSGGRRGSAGGASTFYDGSIFEGIAPTRAASILSFPASYGEAPPSPKFSQAPPSSLHNYGQQQQQQQQPQHQQPLSNPYLRRAARHDTDNFSVDFEREALQRSQNALSNSGSQESLKSGQQQVPAGAGGKKEGGKRGWMSSVFNSSSSSSSSHHHPVAHHHPQQQPLVVPPSYQPSPAHASVAASSSAASVHSASSVGGPHSIRGSGTTSSLKRSPSERSMHNLDSQPSASQLQPAAAAAPAAPLDPKKAKKEAERLAKEAEKAKREAAQRAARDRARAVMQKRSALAQAADPLHNVGQHHLPGIGTKSQAQLDKEKQRMLLEAAARKQQIMLNNKLPQIAEDARLRNLNQHYHAQQQYSPDVRFKARRLDDDGDVHSTTSSNETRSERRFSASSHATASTTSTTNTMDSDPGPRLNDGRLLPPMRRTPSVTSFGGQSHLSVGSQNSGHSGYSSRRDLGTSGSGSSSLEFGLVGRFQGLTAAESSDGRSKTGSHSPGSPPVGAGHGSSDPSSPAFYNQTTPHVTQHHTFAPRSGSSASASPGQAHLHQSHSITLPPISSFDHPPPKEFSFGSTPRSSHSQNSNNSTISGNSGFISPSVYQYHQQQQQQQQQHNHPSQLRHQQQ